MNATTLQFPFRLGPLITALVFVAEVSIAEPKFLELPEAPASVATHSSEAGPATAQEFFNAGTRKLQAGKLREAEALLQTALARQDEAVQPPALYNLGHVRFGQGDEELKKSPPSKPLVRRSAAAGQWAGEAIAQADEALAGTEVPPMVAAYLNGRGAQKELGSAIKAVTRALEVRGAVLRKWQRALGDFKSAAELNPADTNAARNAEIVERAIARLVDSLRELQQSKLDMARGKQKLGEKLQQLKGRIPEPMMPPGAAGGEEEEDEDGKGKNGDEHTLEQQTGKPEGPSKEGEEISISPEEAGWLLEGFSLDGTHRLPMGGDEPGPSKDRNRRNW